jgi:hypothetical protein
MSFRRLISLVQFIVLVVIALASIAVSSAGSAAGRDVVQATPGKAAAEQTFGNIAGGVWKVYSWNTRTETPSLLYGGGSDVSGAIAGADDAVAAAREVIQASRSVLKADLGNLSLAGVFHAAGKIAVHFQQTCRGLGVVGGGVRLVFSDGGELIVAGSDFYSDISVDPDPSLPSGSAIQAAQRALSWFDPATDQVDGEPRLLILPVPVSETTVECRLAWRVTLRTGSPVGLWVTDVDAHDGAILEQQNAISFLDFLGTTRADIQRPSYCEGLSSEALPYVRITIAGVGSTYADADGNWTLSYGGSSPHTVTAQLYGAYADVQNFIGPRATFNGVAVPGVPLQVSFTDNNAQWDERTVYQAINDIHRFFLTFDPSFPYTNQRIAVTVSQDPICTGQPSGPPAFRRAGYACANTGEIMSITCHEYGHGITNYIIGGQGTEGIGEGNSDVLANFITMESTIARGYLLDQCASWIRDSDNALRYPEDVIGHEVHDAGRVIAGFHWEAMQALIAQYGVEDGRLTAARAWHFGRVLLQPTTQPAQVLATFLADDDDGNLVNGTPHYAAFCTAAAAHGFSCPENIPIGACCTPGDGCRMTMESQCQPPDSWEGNGIPCEPNPCDPSGLSSDPLPEAGFSVRTWPNPVSGGEVRICIQTSHPGAVLLEVFSSSGRRVRRLPEEFRPAGRHVVLWNGCDTQGRRLPAGTYLIRMITPEGSIGQKVSLIG